MQASEYKQFAGIWADVHEIMAGGKVFSKRAMDMIFETLEDYSLDMVEQAIKIHTKQGKFAPVPNDIIEIINGNTGQKHIGADEAWGLVLNSFDENLTVIITKEIAEARGLVMDIYQAGDITGARMAFRDAYNRIISTASNPSWFVSKGFDLANQADAVQKAIGLRRLPAGAASNYLIEAPTTTVAELIASANEKANKSSDQKIKEESLRTIKAIVNAPDDDGIARREKKRLAFEQHRQEILARVDKKLQETT